MKQPLFILTFFFSGFVGLSKVSANTVKLNDALKSNQSLSQYSRKWKQHTLLRTSGA
jgi:hypothetical protein